MRWTKRNKENKVTERALYASLFSMVLCCAMLLETTYAWFTQEINTGVAVIQTGEMSVELVIESGDGGFKKAEGNLVFKAADITAVQATAEGSGEQTIAVTALDMAKAAHTSGGDGITYFEPGGTYYLPPIYVMNTGNIDLKYMVTVSFANVKTTSAKSTSEDPASTEGDASGAEPATISADEEIVDLRNVIGFTAFSGAEEKPLSAVENATTVTTDVSSEKIVTENENNQNSIVTGVLEAGVISEPIVIQASMLPDMGIDCANLKLEGIQIIVTATQVIAEDDELIPKSTESGTTQNEDDAQ